jgi:hypothetical protein
MGSKGAAPDLPDDPLDDLHPGATVLVGTPKLRAHKTAPIEPPRAPGSTRRARRAAEAMFAPKLGRKKGSQGTLL